MPRAARRQWDDRLAAETYRNEPKALVMNCLGEATARPDHRCHRHRPRCSLFGQKQPAVNLPRALPVGPNVSARSVPGWPLFCRIGATGLEPGRTSRQGGESATLRQLPGIIVAVAVFDVCLSSPTVDTRNVNESADGSRGEFGTYWNSVGGPAHASQLPPSTTFTVPC